MNRTAFLRQVDVQAQPPVDHQPVCSGFVPGEGRRRAARRVWCLALILNFAIWAVLIWLAGRI